MISKITSRICILLLSCFCFVSCIDNNEPPNTTKGNFEALWNIINEHYCFFDEKQKEYGLDWNEVYKRYAPTASMSLTKAQEFELLSNMLSELRDGHVNLYSTFDVGRYWAWRENYPSNFSQELIDEYLGTNYKIAAGFYYRILTDNTGYIRCASFANTKGEGNLDNVLYYLLTCKGLIIDLRDNSGGLVTAAEQLAARFTNKKVLVGYIQHKTGKGHRDFSPLQAQYLTPSNGLRWQKPVVIITNRGVYSAANEFVKYMKNLPNVTIIGDKTGGGAGMPFSSELPNGWSVRFSAIPSYDSEKKTTEFGIDPHHNVSLNMEDLQRKKDTLIEFARKIIAK